MPTFQSKKRGKEKDTVQCNQGDDFFSLLHSYAVSQCRVRYTAARWLEKYSLLLAIYSDKGRNVTI